jgi:hypothetical protein
MKNLLLSIIVIVITANVSFSQPVSNIVIFSEDGYPFFVVMNGIQENKNAQTNVKIKRLTATNYKVKIIFEDQTIPSIEKNLYTKPDLEVTYRIKKNNKGENVLNYYSEAPIPYEAVNDVVVVNDNTGHSDVVVNNTVPDNSGGVNVNMNVNDGYNSSGVNVNMNVNENGINYNVQTNDGVNVNANINVTDANMNYNETVYNEESHVYVDDQTNNNVYQMPGYTGPVGCDWPMNPADFQRALNSINNADFESDKLTIAKQVVGMNCLTVDQVKQIGMLFAFEDNKLDFAKFAYGRTFDIGNYYILNDMFEFSSSIEELNRYITSH